MGFDLNAFLLKHIQHASAAGEAGDGIAETMDTSQGGVVDASSVPIGRAETAETIRSSQGGVVDASSVSEGRVESEPAQHQPPTPANGTARIPPRSCWGGQYTSSAAGGDPPPTFRGRTRGQSQRVDLLCMMNDEIADARLAAAYEW